MMTAIYSNHGPMRGLLRFLRPEVVGAQRWRVVVKMRRALPDGWDQLDEIVITTPDRVQLGFMKDVAFDQIHEAVAGQDDATVDMEFHVANGRR